MGRLIRMGCASMASINSSSLNLSSVSPNSSKGGTFLRSRSRTGMPMAAIRATRVSRLGGVSR
ncbi:hypothetical protein D3C85_1666010 [compost metagenome]